MRYVLPFVLVAALVLSGCTVGRKTTTERTAVEQALLAQAAERAMDEIAVEGLVGQKFFIKDDHFEATDGKYVKAVVANKMIDSGMIAADTEEEADVLVYPAVANAAIDDKEVLLGSPPLPLAIPGLGALELPKAAFFSLDSQFGRHRSALYGKYRENDRTAFIVEPVGSETYYKRWTVLFFFSFRTTNLDYPF